MRFRSLRHLGAPASIRMPHVQHNLICLTHPPLATNRVHNLANQLSVISFGLTTRKSRSRPKTEGRGPDDHPSASKSMPRTGDKQRYQFQWFDQRQWHQQQGHRLIRALFLDNATCTGKYGHLSSSAPARKRGTSTFQRRCVDKPHIDGTSSV